MYKSIINIRVRYAETDQMGVVHHSRYYPWFEIARSDYVKNTTKSYREMEEMGIMIPLSESYCKYYVGAKYDDEIIIETIIKELKSAKIAFEYLLTRKSDNAKIAKGYTTHAFCDLEFNLLNLKKKYPEIWLKLNDLKERQ